MSKKTKSKLKYFLLAMLLCALAAAIYYKRQSLSKTAESAKAFVEAQIEILTDEFSAYAPATEVPSENEPLRAENAENGEAENDDFIALPKGLELPLCPAINHAADHELRQFENYAICYRESYEQAEWSAYSLSDFQLEKNASRSNDFRPDPQISTGSAALSDYKGSGYDRGHLTPAADMAFSSEAMSETFFMSNMSPQAALFNRGIWKELEAQVRIWAKTFGKVYVVSGAVLEKPCEEYAAIGENAVSVPEFYYKVILAPLYEDELDQKSPDDAKSVIAIGFVIPNQNCEENFWNYAVSIDEVEKRTNLDFYSLLKDDVEDRIEADFRLEDWY